MTLITVEDIILGKLSSKKPTEAKILKRGCKYRLTLSDHQDAGSNKPITGYAQLLSIITEFLCRTNFEKWQD
jgi:hypothetical protein